MDAIIKGGFTPEGLVKLDLYAEQFVSRQLIYKRFSPEEQHGCSAGGSAHVIASLLAGAKDSTNYESEGISGFQREMPSSRETGFKNRVDIFCNITILNVSEG